MPVTASPTQQRAGARSAEAAILARLWGAFAREPLPGLASRETRSGKLTIRWADGTVLTGDAATSQPFAVAPDGLAISITEPGAALPRQVYAPGELVRTLSGVLGRHAARLAAELDNSAANLALARAAQPAPDGGESQLVRAARQPDPLAYLEQSVVDGHPLHPCTRTRTGLAPEQVRAYAPEHRPIVMLRLVPVPADRWRSENLPPLLWLHPWQHERYRVAFPWLSTVDREVPARPLMSLRTLALVTDPAHHVKTAVDIQMTSAVRIVSPAAIHNGRRLAGLMTTLQQRRPTITPFSETAAAAVLTDGEPNRHLAMVVRRRPHLHPGEVALPLAALTAPSAATGEPVVTELGDPLSLVEDLATALLPPVFGLLELGVALEAHGQNVLGVFRDGRLTRLLYRDFGGVRVSAARLRAHGIEPPDLRGDVPADDPEVLRTKVLASAVATVLGEVVAVLSRHTGLEQERAWAAVAAVARRLPGTDAASLFEPTLPLKAMTAMRLAEAAAADQWCEVPNPMAGLR